MDEPKLPISLPDPSAQVGADAAPMPLDGTVVAPNPDQAEASAGSLPESSHVVYCGSEQEVSEGFAIALRMMGLKPNR